MAPIVLMLVQPSKPGTADTSLGAQYKIQAYYCGFIFLSSFFLGITDTLYLAKV